MMEPMSFAEMGQWLLFFAAVFWLLDTFGEKK